MARILTGLLAGSAIAVAAAGFGTPLAHAQVIVGTPVVVDANQAIVGPVVDSAFQDPIGSIVDTVLMVNDLPVELRLVGYYELLRTVEPHPQVAFETTDCSGQGYLVQSGGALINPNLQVGPAVPVQDGASLSVWIPDPLGTQTTIQAIRSLNQLNGGCQVTTIGQAAALPAMEVSTPFIPPFSVSINQSVGSVDPLSVPAVTPVGLGLLGVLLCATGVWYLRR